MKKIIIFILLIGVISGAVFYYFQQQKNKNNKSIKVSGNIEATEVRVSFRVGGKILQLLTDEGRNVKNGDLVAKLDTDELAKIRNQAEAALKAAEYEYSLAKDDYTRAENLFNAGSFSAQKRDTARTRADAGKSNVDALSASLELANTRLGFAELVSPIEGFVLVKSAEEGEVVQAGSVIFTIANLRDIWLTAYVNETDLGKVKLNQEVNVKIDTYADKVYKGRISYISEESEFTPKQIQTTEERVKLVYRIKVNLDNPNLELKPGMPADGYIVE
jgi:HlyD family secretion protein